MIGEQIKRGRQGSSRPRETDNLYCPRCGRAVDYGESSICETHRFCGALLMPLWMSGAREGRRPRRSSPAAPLNGA